MYIICIIKLCYMIYVCSCLESDDTTSRLQQVAGMNHKSSAHAHSVISALMSKGRKPGPSVPKCSGRPFIWS